MISRRIAAALAIFAGAFGLTTVRRLAELPVWTGQGRFFELAATAMAADPLSFAGKLAVEILAVGIAYVLLIEASCRLSRQQPLSRRRATHVWLPTIAGGSVGGAALVLDPWFHHSTASLLAVSGIGFGLLLSLSRSWRAGAAATAAAHSADSATGNRQGQLDYPRALIAGGAVLVVIAMVSPLTPTWHKLLGDEPHYLLMTHSLIVDGDLELSANYNDADYFGFFPAQNLSPHTKPGLVERSRYSIHSYGLSALLVPWYALARGTSLPTFTFIVRAGASLWLGAFAWILFGLIADMGGQSAAA